MKLLHLIILLGGYIIYFLGWQCLCTKRDRESGDIQDFNIVVEFLCIVSPRRLCYIDIEVVSGEAKTSSSRRCNGSIKSSHMLRQN